MEWWNTVLDFVYPRFCAGCEKQGEDLCEECLRDLEIADQICPMCGVGSEYGWTHERCKRREGLDGLICIYSYEDKRVGMAIDELKFGFNKVMVDRLLEGFVFESGVVFDAVVPMPLHFYRENWRGFNQAELIAGKISEGIAGVTRRWLVKRRNTPQQAKLTSRDERIKNIEGAFEAAEEVAGKKILLVDDVYTSGASMREAAKSLKEMGAVMVWGLVLAH